MRAILIVTALLLAGCGTSTTSWTPMRLVAEPMGVEPRRDDPRDARFNCVTLKTGSILCQRRRVTVRYE